MNTVPEVLIFTKVDITADFIGTKCNERLTCHWSRHRPEMRLPSVAMESRIKSAPGGGCPEVPSTCNVRLHVKKTIPPMKYTLGECQHWPHKARNPSSSEYRLPLMRQIIDSATILTIIRCQFTQLRISCLSTDHGRLYTINSCRRISHPICTITPTRYLRCLSRRHHRLPRPPLSLCLPHITRRWSHPYCCASRSLVVAGLLCNPCRQRSLISPLAYPLALLGSEPPIVPGGRPQIAFALSSAEKPAAQLEAQAEQPPSHSILQPHRNLWPITTIIDGEAATRATREGRGYHRKLPHHSQIAA